VITITSCYSRGTERPHRRNSTYPILVQRRSPRITRVWPQTGSLAIQLFLQPHGGVQHTDRPHYSRRSNKQRLCYVTRCGLKKELERRRLSNWISNSKVEVLNLCRISSLQFCLCQWALWCGKTELKGTSEIGIRTDGMGKLPTSHFKTVVLHWQEIRNWYIDIPYLMHSVDAAYCYRRSGVVWVQYVNSALHPSGVAVSSTSFFFGGGVKYWRECHLCWVAGNTV